MVFWVNLPVGAISLLMFALFLHEPVERREHRIDYLGGALLIVGVGALMLALVQATTLTACRHCRPRRRWAAARSPRLLVHERRVPEPMLPLSLWRRRVVVLCNLGGFGGSATYMAVTALSADLCAGRDGATARALPGFVIGAASVSWMFAASRRAG